MKAPVPDVPRSAVTCPRGLSVLLAGSRLHQAVQQTRHQFPPEAAMMAMAPVGPSTSPWPPAATPGPACSAWAAERLWTARRSGPKH